MKPLQLKPGTLVQLDPTTCRNLMLAGCVMTVKETKPHGAMGYVQGCGANGQMGGQHYYLALWDEMELCGLAPFTVNIEPDEQQLQHMTEPELAAHLNLQLSFIKKCQTDDTNGSMLVIFGADGITQYGATLDPETAPQALRELADRIERRETVKR